MSNLSQDADQQQDLDLEQEYAFGGSAMPLMSLIGEAAREILETRVKGLAESWKYYDRLLCWLEPAFCGDVKNFYDEAGPDMRRLFAKHQRIHLDRDLSKLLLERMWKIDRETTQTVIQWIREMLVIPPQAQ